MATEATVMTPTFLQVSVCDYTQTARARTRVTVKIRDARLLLPPRFYAEGLRGGASLVFSPQVMVMGSSGGRPLP